jgi:hypothetical protein
VYFAGIFAGVFIECVKVHYVHAVLFQSTKTSIDAAAAVKDAEFLPYGISQFHD